MAESPKNPMQRWDVSEESSLDPSVAPWTQQPEESPEAFEAFVIYRDLGTRRSQARVASELGKDKSLISRWSREWSWRERIWHWAREVDRRRREELLELSVEMSERHIRQLRALSEIVSRPAIDMLRELQDNPQLVRDIMRDDPARGLEIIQQAARILPELMKAERLALGQPTEIHQGTDLNRTEVRRVLEDEQAVENAMYLLEAISEGDPQHD